MKRIAIILAFIFAAPSAFALSLSDIETQVRRHTRDTSSTASLQQNTDSVLDAYINEVQKDVTNQMPVWLVVGSTSVTLAANTTYYDMPSDAVVPLRVTFRDASSEVTEVKETDYHTLLIENPQYETNSTGEPTEYFVRQSTSGDNALEFGVYPVPTSSSTGTIRMDYGAYPADLSSDSDVPFNGLLHLYPYHEVLVWGTVVRVKLAQNKADEVPTYMKLYADGLALMRAKVNEMPNLRRDFSGGPR